MGHNPDLFIFDKDGQEVEKIDLSPVNSFLCDESFIIFICSQYSTAELHELMVKKGFERKANGFAASSVNTTKESLK